MQVIFLESFISRAYLRPSPSGRASVVCFRPNDKSPKRVWHKPVPRLFTHDLVGSWYFFGEFAAPEVAAEILPHVIVPVDAPWHPKTFAPDVVVSPAASQLADELRDKLTYYESAVPRPALNKMRKQLIKDMVQKFSSVAPEGPMRPVHEAVAFLLDCGLVTVQRVMAEDGAQPVPTVSKEYKEDPRWRPVLHAVATARSAAYQLDVRARPGAVPMTGKFSAENLLIEHKGEKLYPLVCPVLGMELEYNRFDHPKAPSLICVGRADIRSPYAAGNVVLMSALGRKVTEGKVAASALSEAQRVAYQRYQDVTNTTPPSDTTSPTEPTTVKIRFSEVLGRADDDDDETDIFADIMKNIKT